MTSQLNPEWLALGPARIDQYVKKRSKGVYVLTLVREQPILYVGRSDKDNLNERLKDHRTNTSPSKNQQYAYFKFKITSSEKEAYEDECRLWHEHGAPPPDNMIHPDKPDGTTYSCPVTGCKT